jgi:hypothetical protein
LGAAETGAIHGALGQGESDAVRKTKIRYTDHNMTPNRNIIMALNSKNNRCHISKPEQQVLKRKMFVQKKSEKKCHFLSKKVTHFVSKNEHLFFGQK